LIAIEEQAIYMCCICSIHEEAAYKIPVIIVAIASII